MQSTQARAAKCRSPPTRSIRAPPQAAGDLTIAGPAQPRQSTPAGRSLPEQIAANRWLPDDELRVYTEEYRRTGFQGGLNGYRSGEIGAAEQELFADRTIDQPSIFISGTSDWGSYQSPGALERMQNRACTDMRGVHLVDGAGHWVQQE